MIMEIVNDLRNGNLSPDEYVGRTFDRIRRVEEKVRAFVTLRDEKDVLEEVKKAVKGEGRLSGLLIAVKDNISTRGIRTTCSSKMLENYVPPYDATVISKLKREGAVILGKTNMDEFAMGSTTETSYFGPTRNPWDLSRTPGGSSGGSGSALASGYVDVALGSDTGGSIRTPASFTSTYGLKPSYGTVSRYGLVAYANSLEQIGPMARNSTDLALLFSIIAGSDQRDATTIDYSSPSSINPITVKGIKVGVLKDVMEASDPGVVGVVKDFLNKMSSEGAVIEETNLGMVNYVLPTYYIIAMSEASSNLARYDGVRYGYSSNAEGNWRDVYSRNRGEGFGKEVKRRILLGSFILSAGYYEQFYIRALKTRRLIRDSLEKLFSRYDILVSPTSPILPPKIGEVIDDPVKMYAIDVATVTANLAAIPALSIPAGFHNGLPVGVQLMGRYLSDTFLMGVSLYMENVTKLKDLTAPI
ncbi:MULTISPECIES: Asp-tRNA(Asn)/Glu-tRNA(Gln) amidotransferase subunit GatA [Metallosphaera]|uniref:Glutamyl-tRNA(Gln) amidotransferase subunit A n=3 Tax=Metallosphaera TaxID=41980 RepID=A4YHJ2_METS5|nr:MULTISPECIES: Asp-tRNA(Asn)/Glu-tRNA(Gln) amidotransferase subunit GatA [Metallosphaera]ABP95894.1 aspartyl/glutamyl-tRNA(Asn/Gln) amidotransferase subunit A [Metallosphaera sedula DSM 5348]AIM27878.1 aspartyl/glutamyl-tRNA(Asn/Gln) amidotransferase subunit A [Metallosphaera sedula]AKV74717.1 glutamyl-tRNA amidotransferase [Metallosphaera sedula]AKV76955.1 glutamyl-tRNA amidotransferase [Metallosphaera sedula]AKV79206.1 glutamyl-tRNA amidotransferase [Metallosphaera sedula]